MNDTNLKLVFYFFYQFFPNQNQNTAENWKHNDSMGEKWIFPQIRC